MKHTSTTPKPIDTPRAANRIPQQHSKVKIYPSPTPSKEDCVYLRAEKGNTPLQSPTVARTASSSLQNLIKHYG